MGDFEVVRSDVDGWDVRRVGEAQALSNFATRELAEAAARKEQEAEHSSGSSSDAIDVRQDVFSEGPEEELDAKKTLIGAGMVMGGVILLIAVVAVILVATGITT
jgi:hypothetical protein